MSYGQGHIVRNILSNYAASIVGGLIFIVLTPYVVGKLGIVGYGVWVLVGVIGYFINYLDFGLDDAQLKYIAEFDGSGDPDSVNRLLVTALSVHSLIGLGAFTITLLLAVLPAEQLFNVPAEAVPEFKIVLILLGINLLFGFPASVVEGVFEGFQRFDVANILNVSFAIGGAVATVVVLELGYGLVGLAGLEIVLTALGIGVDLYVIKRLFPDVSIRCLKIDSDIWSKMKSFGKWSFLDDMLTEGTAHLDKLILPVVLSVSLLTPYSLMMALAALVLFVSEPITDVFFPKAAELNARSELDQLQRLWGDGTRAVIAVATPVAVVAAIFGETILAVWVGSDFVALPEATLPLLVSNLYVSAVFWTATTLLLGLGLVRKVFWFSVFEVVLGLALILFLAPRYGIVGFVTGMLVANLAAAFLMAVPTTASALSQPMHTFLFRSLVAPMLACLPAFAAALAVEFWLQPRTLLELVVALLLVFVVHGAAFLVLGMNRSEREKCLQELRTSLLPNP